MVNLLGNQNNMSFGLSRARIAVNDNARNLGKALQAEKSLDKNGFDISSITIYHTDKKSSSEDPTSGRQCYQFNYNYKKQPENSTHFERVVAEQVLAPLGFTVDLNIKHKTDDQVFGNKNEQNLSEKDSQKPADLLLKEGKIAVKEAFSDIKDELQ